MYGIAVYATLILLIVQIVIHKILPVENTSTASVSMKLVDDAEAVETISNIFKKNNYEILSTSVEKKNEVSHRARALVSMMNELENYY